ncbi:MAG: hypothetical protein GF315_14830, partial [candidate division Zixibacteria bacterium]|nr:hypothetical protein [candidate division Zixibacteria bacterium]
MINCRILLIVSIVFLTALAEATLGQDTLWVQTYNIGRVYDVHNTEDGGFILGCDMSFIRTDSMGNALWISTFGGEPFHRYYSIFELDDGYMGAGCGTGPSSRDFLLVRMNESGDSLWSSTFGTQHDDYAYSADKTDDGGYILAGKTYASEYDDATDILVVKTDSLGGTLWSNTHGTFGTDYANSIKQTSDGGYIITGYRSNAEAGYLIKTDEYGEEEWYVLEMEGPGSIFYSVKQTMDGGYIAAGNKEIWGYPSYFVYYLTKYDSLGNKQWERQFGDAPYWNQSRDVLQTVDGGYLIVGRKIDYHGGGNPAGFMLRTDSDGNELWSSIYPTEEGSWLFAVAQIAENVYVASGTFDGYCWLMKFQEPSYCCEVDMIPDDDPIVVQPGGSFGYTGTLINSTEESLAFDVWVG